MKRHSTHFLSTSHRRVTTGRHHVGRTNIDKRNIGSICSVLRNLAGALHLRAILFACSLGRGMSIRSQWARLRAGCTRPIARFSNGRMHIYRIVACTELGMTRSLLLLLAAAVTGTGLVPQSFDARTVGGPESGKPSGREWRSRLCCGGRALSWLRSCWRGSGHVTP